MANFPTSLPSATPATHGVVVDEIRAIALSPVSHPPYVTGRNYPAAPVASNAFTATPALNDLELHWCNLPDGAQLSELRAEVTTLGAAGSVVRAAAYAHSASTGMPTTLLWDGGTISAETTGFKAWTGIGLTVAGMNGLWLGLVVQGATCVVRSINLTQPGIHLATASITGSAPWVGFRHSSVTGAAPNPFTTTPVLTGTVARLFMLLA